MDERKDLFELEQENEVFEEERDEEARQKQRRWLASLLEEKGEGKTSKYRLKEAVPLPERRDYLVRISDTPFNSVNGQDTAMESFAQKVEGIKVCQYADKESGAIGVASNFKEYLSEDFSTVMVSPPLTGEIGIVSKKEIHISPVEIEFPEQAVLSAEIDEETKAKLTEIKAETEQIVGQDASFVIDTDINSEMILPEDFGIPDIDFSVESVNIQRITGQTVKTVRDSVQALEIHSEMSELGIEKKLDMTLPTVDIPAFAAEEQQRVNVSSVLEGVVCEVQLAPVNVEIRNLAEEVCGLPEERNNRAIEEMMKEMASFTVSMPDFTEVWETMK